jgi:hypothetical protein
MDHKINPFIFFLTLENDLPDSFYIFDRNLKELGYILVPVKVDQLQSLSASTSQEEIIVICSVLGSREFAIYNKKVRGLLKYVLKTKRITLMHLSSFSRLNDSKLYNQQKNYFFMKYPLDARILSGMISRFYNLKSGNSSRWPGGRRAGVNGMVA